jgi:glycosyltransferase involved in cell wall biosynthesis
MEVWRAGGMKILLINYEYPPFGGGAGNATQEIGRALTKMGYAVTALIGGKGDLYTDPDGIRVRPVGSSRKHFSQASFKEMFSFLLRGVFWALGSRSRDFDLTIVFFALPCGPIATFLNKRWHVPYIVSLRGGDVPGLVPAIEPLHRFLAPLRRWVNKNAKAVVANSPSLAELAQASDTVSVTVIPNGVDTEYYRPSDNNIGVKSAPLRLLLVGRFHRQKLIPETIQWLARAKSQGIEFLVTIVGDGPERDAVEATIEDVDMTKFISLKGWLGKDELIKQYQQADCYLNLSSYEGMPNTVLEAMACALPVIASDIPPHRGLVEHQVTGYLVDLDRPESLIDQLTELATNRHRGKVMGEAGRQLVLAGHSWTAVANSYMALFVQRQKRSPDYVV